MTQYPAVIDLADIDGTNGFRISGAPQYRHSGYSVGSAGDVNGDGFSDLVIGSQFSGAYVVFGRSAGFGPSFDLSTLDGTNGFAINGGGHTVSSAGDVNGDGFDDVIIGGIKGQSAVVFGKASGFDPAVDTASLDGSDGFRIGATTYGTSPVSATSAGDINGDGFGDLIVGLVQNGTSFGAAYILFGKASGFSALVDPSKVDGTNGFRFHGPAPNEYFGHAVSSAGDINGDGFDDIVVGSPFASPHGHYSGETYVVFGKAGGFQPTLDITTLDGSNGFSISGETGGGLSGYSVGSAGDINGDGYADLLIGAERTATASGPNAGVSYVVFGKASGFGANIKLSSLDGDNGFRIADRTAHDYSGHTVSSAGDVNGDGFDDVIIATFHTRGQTLPDASYVVFGKSDGFAATLDPATLDGSNGFIIEGAGGGDGAGVSAASAGDLNHDGLGDLIVGAPLASADGLSGSGASYVIYGRAPDAAVERIGTIAGQNLVGGGFDDTLSGLAGDDHLYGAAGADALDGGKDRDTLIGGAGGDTLTGGAGKDHFVFLATNDSRGRAPDIILDLEQKDRVDLSAIDANTGKAGDQAFHLVAAFSGHAGELVLKYHQAGPDAGFTTVKADINGDGMADMSILIAGDHAGYDHFVL